MDLAVFTLPLWLQALLIKLRTGVVIMGPELLGSFGGYFQEQE